MIKRIILSVLLCGLLPTVVYSAPLPEIIKTYYGYMQRMRTASNADEALTLRKKLQKCFFEPREDNGDGGFSGVNVMDNYIGKEIVASRTFSNRIGRAIHDDKTLSIVSYKMGDVIKSAQPNLSGTKDDIIYQVPVDVSYTYNGRSLNCVDYISIYESSIVRVSDKGIFDIEQATIDAGNYYAKKKYKEAYAEYKKILENDPDDLNALYRIGIMTAKGHGVKKDRKEAINILNKVAYGRVSSKNVFYSIWRLSDKARDAIYFLEHPHTV